MAGRAQHGRAAENCRANIARIGSTTADVGSSTNQRELRITQNQQYELEYSGAVPIVNAQ